MNRFKDLVKTERWLAGDDLPGLSDKELDEVYLQAEKDFWKLREPDSVVYIEHE